MKHSLKIIILIALMLFQHKSFSAVSDSIPILTVEANITALNEAALLKFPNLDSKYYFITITIRNTQDTSIHFQIMTCSWSSSFVTDTDSITLRLQECDNNFPTTIEIKPGKSVQFFAELLSSKRNLNQNQPVNFKIGFVDFSYKDLWNFKRLSKNEMSKHKIYWSNSISLVSRLNSYKLTISDKSLTYQYARLLLTTAFKNCGLTGLFQQKFTNQHYQVGLTEHRPFAAFGYALSAANLYCDFE